MSIFQPTNNIINLEKTNTVKIKGGNRLKGIVNSQGSKNAALPVLASLILVPKAKIYNVPNLSDIREMIRILNYLGAECQLKNGVLYYDGKDVENKVINSEFTNKMRASSLFLGPLLSKFGSSSVGMPGGCVIGSRPLDIHMEGFKSLGANHTLDHGLIHIDNTSISGKYILPFPSVGATQNLISSAVFCKDKVILQNVAIEPEVIELIDFLNKAGAKITLNPDKSIEIKGVKKLRSVDFSIQPDRIEVFTILAAAVASKGEVKVINCNPQHLQAPLSKLRDMGVHIKTGRNWIKATYRFPLQGVKVKTGVYPSFPTDCQQQISALMLQSTSPSLLIETIFNSRFKHLEEYRKLGAEIKIENNLALIEPAILTACSLEGFDLRGAASMIIASLMLNEESEVSGLQYLHRGYESFVEKLNYLGAEITYV